MFTHNNQDTRRSLRNKIKKERMKGQLGVVAFFLLLVVCYVAGNKCDRSTFEKVGCFKRQDKLFPHLIVNDRDPTHANFSGRYIDWKNYASYLHSLACRCADITKAIKYHYFAIGFYGECWSGYDKSLFQQLMDDSSQGARTCIDGEYWACTTNVVEECTGGANTEYVYKLITDEEEEEGEM